MNKIKVGFFSFTEITNPKEHRSYNTWHLFDHVPENRALPGVVHGERWVATPDCIKVRFADPALAATHYLTNYLMTEPIELTLKDFYDLGAQMGYVGRFYRHRRGLMGGPFLLVKAYAAPRVLVSPESIPYRPTRGIFVTVTDPVDRAQQDALHEWYDQVHIPDMLTVKGVAGVYWYVSRGSEARTFAQDVPPGRVIRVYYLDEDPIAMIQDMRAKASEWQAQGRMMDTSKAVKTLFAGPFRTIVPFQDDWAESMR